MSWRGWLAVALVGGIAVGAAFSVPHLEGRAPSIGTIEALPIGRDGRTLSVELADPDSGLRQVEVRLLHGGGSKTLLSRDFPGSLLGGAPGTELERVDLHIDPEELALPDGPLSLVVIARDWSWREGFAGNRSERSVQLRIDTKAPDIRVHSGITYVRRGGSGVAIYSVSESQTRDGVQLEGHFFRGHPIDDRRRAALFAVPVDAAHPPVARVIAVDEAGNESSTPFPLRTQERRFPESSVPLTRDFLERKMAELAHELKVNTSDPVVAFQWINANARAENERRIRQLISDSAPRPLWSGVFEQMRSSKVMSRFAERRLYLLDGRIVSRARHYGFDLASTAAATITAANAGVVVFAGSLGIYGHSVLLDHGLGLSSLYAHLSRLDVAPQQEVQKGEPLGLSGATGLAGGDHLHFAVLVGDTYVDPMEWWDPRWLRSHVEVHLGRAGS